MSIKVFYVGLILSVAFLPVSAFSSEEQSASGAGTMSCGEYLKHKADTHVLNIFISWSQGFLSGMNIADRIENRQLVLLPDASSIEAYLDKYCKDNPLKNPLVGSLLLYKELRR